MIRFTSCLVLRWGFRGRQIERGYLRFEQIQDSGHCHVGKISSGDISATGRLIHFMFCSRVGFSGTADLMALLSIRANSRGRRPPFWLISNGHISATAHDLLIYSAHRAVIFMIAQLSCKPQYTCLIIVCMNYILNGHISAIKRMIRYTACLVL